jgi:hypothetical protein
VTAAVVVGDQQHPTVAEDDTGYYVYGVVAAADGRVPADLVGVDQAPVHTVDHDGVSAVVAVIDLERPPGRRADLVAHSAVLDALASTGAVVPVQFGSLMSDAESVVEDLLAPQLEHFADLLEQLEGRSQYNLRATYHEHVVLAEVVGGDPEIAELSRRTRDLPEDVAYPDRVRLGELVARSVDAKRADDAEVLLESVLPHTDAYSTREGAGIVHVLDVALLVEQSRRQEFEEHLEGLAEAVHERIRLRLVGPVAPYDFVSGD